MGCETLPFNVVSNYSLNYFLRIKFQTLQFTISLSYGHNKLALQIILIIDYTVITFWWIDDHQSFSLWNVNKKITQSESLRWHQPDIQFKTTWNTEMQQMLRFRSWNYRLYAIFCWIDKSINQLTASGLHWSEYLWVLLAIPIGHLELLDIKMVISTIFWHLMENICRYSIMKILVNCSPKAVPVVRLFYLKDFKVTVSRKRTKLKSENKSRSRC